MAELDYRHIFDQAKAALETLHVKKANLETELDRVTGEIEDATKLYNTVAPVLHEFRIPSAADALLPPITGNLNTVGITVAVRMLLNSLPDEDFTAARMRDQLSSKGYEWSGINHPLPAVHTVLVRLAKSGLAKETTTPEGKKSFYSAIRERTQPVIARYRSARIDPEAPPGARVPFAPPGADNTPLTEKAPKAITDARKEKRE